MDVKTGKNQTKPAHIKSRADFYEWLTKMSYKNVATPVEGLREGALLEAGLARVTRRFWRR